MSPGDIKMPHTSKTKHKTKTLVFEGQTIGKYHTPSADHTKPFDCGRIFSVVARNWLTLSSLTVGRKNIPYIITLRAVVAMTCLTPKWVSSPLLHGAKQHVHLKTIGSKTKASWNRHLLLLSTPVVLPSSSLAPLTTLFPLGLPSIFRTLSLHTGAHPAIKSVPPKPCWFSSLRKGVTFKYLISLATTIHQLLRQSWLLQVFWFMSEQRISRELCKGRRSTEQVSLLPREVIALHVHRFLVAPSSSRKGFAAINPILWPVCHVTDIWQDFNKVTAWCKTTGSKKRKGEIRVYAANHALDTKRIPERECSLALHF